MRSVALLGVALLPACRSLPPPPVADPASLRHLPQGDVVGTVGVHGDWVWRGLPYAAPPVGDLRWRAPEPPRPWTGTREALESGPPCVQYAGRFAGVAEVPEGTPTGREDCLVADVTDAGGGVRMAPDTVSRDGLLAALATDARLARPRDRCLVYRLLADWGLGLTAADYPRVAGPACAGLTFDGLDDG